LLMFNRDFTEDKRSVFNRGVTLTPEPLNL
jgi:hypothetical protein